MCEYVSVTRKDGSRVWCDNIGELASALRRLRADIPFDRANYPGFAWLPDNCLCPLDARALARDMGWRVVKHGYDGGHYGEWELIEQITSPETV